MIVILNKYIYIYTYIYFRKNISAFLNCVILIASDYPHFGAVFNLYSFSSPILLKSISFVNQAILVIVLFIYKKCIRRDYWTNFPLQPTKTEALWDNQTIMIRIVLHREKNEKDHSRVFTSIAISPSFIYFRLKLTFKT